MAAWTIDRWLLTPDELNALTGKRRSDAHMRALDEMGITFRQRPDGTVAVLRKHVETVLGLKASGGPPKREPELRF